MKRWSGRNTWHWGVAFGLLLPLHFALACPEFAQLKEKQNGRVENSAFSDALIWLSTDPSPEGQNEALTQLRNQKMAWMQRLARRVGASEDALEEIVNDALSRIWAKRESFDYRSEEDSRGYVARIVKNLAIDDVRRKKARIDSGFQNRAGDDGEIPNYDVIDPGERVDHQVEKREILQLLDAAIKEAPLSDVQSAVLREHRTGKNYPEIAKALGIPLPSVKSAVRRILEKVRERLVPSGEQNSSEALPSPGISTKEPPVAKREKVSSRRKIEKEPPSAKIETLHSRGLTKEQVAGSLGIPHYRVRADLDKKHIEKLISAQNSDGTLAPVERIIFSQTQFEFGIAKLSNQDREIMRSYLVKKKSYGEIRPKWGLGKDGVERRVALARAKLCKELGSGLPGPGNEIRILSDEDYELHFGRSAREKVKEGAPVSVEEPKPEEGILHLSIEQFESAIENIPYHRTKDIEERRELLRLFFVEGLSNEKIRAKIGGTLGNINRRLDRDIRQLSHILNEPKLKSRDQLRVTNQKERRLKSKKAKVQKRQRGKSLEADKTQFQLTRNELRTSIEKEFPKSDIRRALVIGNLLEGKKSPELALAFGRKPDATYTLINRAITQLGKNQLGIQNLRREDLQVVEKLEETKTTLAKPRPFVSMTEEDFDRTIAEISSPKFRRILRLRFVLGYSPGQLPVITQTKPATASSDLSTAFRELAVLLNRPQLDPSDFGVRRTPKTLQP